MPIKILRLRILWQYPTIIYLFHLVVYHLRKYLALSFLDQMPKLICLLRYPISILFKRIKIFMIFHSVVIFSHFQYFKLIQLLKVMQSLLSLNLEYKKYSIFLIWCISITFLWWCINDSLTKSNWWIWNLDFNLWVHWSQIMHNTIQI